jgi:predicted dehydrogenase
MSLRAALIGCGKIGSEFADDPRIAGIYTHAAAWCACPGVDLVAVCDTDAERARRCAERWQVSEWYVDAAEMLERVRPDLVSICTPDSTHANTISLTLNTPAVRGILAEKPLATTLVDARALAERAAALGVVIAVNYSRRYAAGHRELARRVRDGLLGELRHVRGCFTNGTIHNGTHWFDWARMFAGEVASARGYDVLCEGGADPSLDARLEFANGAVGELAALDQCHFSLFEIDLVGSAGRMRLFDSGHCYRIDRVGDSTRYSGYRTLLESEGGEADMRDTILNAADDLVDAIRHGRQPICTVQDALATLSVAEAVRSSAAAGGCVTVVER